MRNLEISHSTLIKLRKKTDQQPQSEYNDKMMCFIKGGKKRLYIISSQFVGICIIYIILGIYSISSSGTFYQAMEYSLSIAKCASFRLPEMTLIVSAMRREMLTMTNLKDINGTLIFDAYYDKFIQNEIEFSQYNEIFKQYYPSERKTVEEIETKNVCSIFLSDQNEEECLSAFQGLLRFGMKTGINSILEYVATSMFKIRETNTNPPANATAWIISTCSNIFFLNITDFYSMYFITLNERAMDYYISCANNYGIRTQNESLYKFIVAIGVSLIIFLCYVEIVMRMHNTFIWRGGHLLSKLPLEKMVEYKEQISKLIGKII